MVRNLLEYPITDDERKQTLKQIKDEIIGDPLDPPIGDLRLCILQDAIDAIDEKNTIMNIAGDDALKEEIKKLKDQLYAANMRDSLRHRQSRDNLIQTLESAGMKPGMWARWRDNPPPLNTSKNIRIDEVVYAIIDALTQEGITAWNGDATGCVSQMIYAQMKNRRKLFEALTRITFSETDDADTLRDIAKDSILDLL